VGQWGEGGDGGGGKGEGEVREAMQEGQITVGDETIALPETFWVLATQNPIEHEGTYPLPEAQLDRFLMKLVVAYPAREAELTMLDLPGLVAPATAPPPGPLLGPEDVRSLRRQPPRLPPAPPTPPSLL